ncbi:hypothetical protein VTL71DRAFT_15252 [Oculimacula yallundae]|uniref:SET domain-containing protein n=1 Tax=Oculimacula yallundae TaxID=86028 RepID=A0ABR4CIC8_9HELO
MPRTQELLSWASGHGTSLHPDVEIYRDPITGSSFRALQDIEPGTTLVKCSLRTTLSYLNAIGASAVFQCHSPPFPPRFINALETDHPNIIGHFFLIQQYLLGSDSFWWNYIRLLPQPDAPEKLGLPVWWPEADRAFLAGMNAEPPIQQRKALWEEEWKRGLSLLEAEYPDRKRYTYHLYQWAGSIFGSRSFRPSLTILSELITATEVAHHDMAFKELMHIKEDRFSVLLPVTDIGNHNGINQVNWSLDPAEGVFSLSNCGPILKGSQIYNFYGDKSNNELLVAYGFILPDTSKDTVNIRVTPPPEAALLRRSQSSHVKDPNQPEAEFLFHVRVLERGLHEGNLALNIFSPGLVNTMSCVFANSRERRYLEANASYSVETDANKFCGSMSRNAVMILRTLYDKLVNEVSRTEKSGTELGEPSNQNQRLAVEFRKRQIQALQSAMRPISSLLQEIHKDSTFLNPSAHDDLQILGSPKKRFAEFITVENSFSWLHVQYQEISSEVCRLIAEDQGEPLPLNWTILVEDWCHTYWVVWIYLVWMLWLQDRSFFKARHPKLTAWIDQINSSYNEVLSQDPTRSILSADHDEQVTIDYMIQNTSQILNLAETSARHPDMIVRIRNFASLVATEECVVAWDHMTAEASEVPVQKLLCIWTPDKADQHVQDGGPWADFLASVSGWSKRSDR